MGRRADPHGLLLGPLRVRAPDLGDRLLLAGCRHCRSVEAVAFEPEADIVHRGANDDSPAASRSPLTTRCGRSPLQNRRRNAVIQMTVGQPSCVNLGEG